MLTHRRIDTDISTAAIDGLGALDSADRLQCEDRLAAAGRVRKELPLRASVIRH